MKKEIGIIWICVKNKIVIGHMKCKNCLYIFNKLYKFLIFLIEFLNNINLIKYNY